MFGYPGRGRFAVLLALAVGLSARSADRPANEPAAALPPWQRLLRGEEARRAKQLQEQVDRHWAAADFEQALKPAQELAALRGQVQGPDHWGAVNARWKVKALERIRQQGAAQQKNMAHVPALERQASALEAKGRARDAVPLRQQILDACRKLLGEDHPDTATGYNNLAVNQNAQGKYAEAEAQLTGRPWTCDRKLLGEEHPDTAASYNNLAVNLNAQGKYAEAEPSYQKALDLPASCWARSTPHTATSYNNLASNLDAQGKYAEAERSHQKALDLCRKLLGEDHPDTATSYNNLAVNLNAQGKYAEAERSFQKALDLRRKLLGEEHPDTATSYNNLAVNLNAQGKYAEAEAHLPEGPGPAPQAAGRGPPRHRHQLQQPGRQPERPGQVRRGRSATTSKALDLRRKLLGEDHPDTATSYNNLAAQPERPGQVRRGRTQLPEGPGPAAASCWARTTPTPPPATTTWPPT